MVEDLPQELLREIANSLDGPTRLSLALSSKRLFTLATFALLPRNEFICQCCELGYENILEYILDRKSFKAKWEHVALAARNGHYHLFRSLIENHGGRVDAGIVRCAMFSGNVELIRYFILDRRFDFDYEAMKELGRSGNLEAVQEAEKLLHFLDHSLFGNHYGYAVLSGARRSGNLDLMKFLQSDLAIDRDDARAAIELGHYDVFDWVVNGFLRQYMKQATSLVNEVAYIPHFAQFLKHLDEIGWEYSLSFAISDAIENGHLDALEYLLEAKGAKAREILLYQSLRPPILSRNLDLVRYALGQGVELKLVDYMIATRLQWQPMLDLLEERKCPTWAAQLPVTYPNTPIFDEFESVFNDFVTNVRPQKNSEYIELAIKHAYPLTFICGLIDTDNRDYPFTPQNAKTALHRNDQFFLAVMAMLLKARIPVDLCELRILAERESLERHAVYLAELIDTKDEGEDPTWTLRYHEDYDTRYQVDEAEPLQ